MQLVGGSGGVFGGGCWGFTVALRVVQTGLRTMES